MGSCLSHVCKNKLEVDAEVSHNNGKRPTSPSQVALADKRHDRCLYKDGMYNSKVEKQEKQLKDVEKFTDEKDKDIFNLKENHCRHIEEESIKHECERKVSDTKIENISDRMPNEETNLNVAEDSETSKRSKTHPKKEKKKKKKKKDKNKIKENNKRSKEDQNHQKNNRTTDDSELTKIKEENEALKQEIDILSTRLSAVASAKLTDGNPNIADLSDANRPTKLAEQYSELYDNEWTDAFDVLSKNRVPDEQAACRMLLEIFCLVYETCLQKANDELHNVMDGIKAFIGCQEPPIEVMKSLKDQRKRHFKEQCKQIKMLQGLSDGIKEILQTTSIRKDKKMEAFVNNSIELSWLMVVQDPPVFVDNNIERCDELFVSNELKAYTKSGTYIDFIVWPTLYLHKGGNILCKGIAQCKADTNHTNVRMQIVPEETTEDKTDTDEMHLKNESGNDLVTNVASNLPRDKDLTSTAQINKEIETDETISISSCWSNEKDTQLVMSGCKKKSIVKKILEPVANRMVKSVSENRDQLNNTETSTTSVDEIHVPSDQTKIFESENIQQNLTLSSTMKSSFSNSSIQTELLNVPQNDADSTSLN